MSRSLLEAPCRVLDVRVSDATKPLPEVGSERSWLVVMWTDNGEALDALALGRRELPSAARRVAARARALAASTPATRPAATLPTTGEPACLADVSVVVCTRDRPDALVRCLDSLARSTTTPGEVVVVDNAPRTGAVRDLLAGRRGVLYVVEPLAGLSVARNAGIRAATGAIIAFTDDDAVVAETWLERLVAPFVNPDVDVVTGLALPAELETAAQVLFERVAGFSRGFTPRTFDAAWFARHRSTGAPVWDIGAGVNMCVRRSALDRVGRFDPRLGAGAAGCSEDSELWYRVLATGGRCVYHPAAVVRHYHRRDATSLESQLFAYMRGHVVALLVQFQQHADLGNLRRLAWSLPKHYLAVVAAAVRHPRDPRNRLIAAEVRGCLAGLWYYTASGS